ncbi:hypothetical protein CK489_16605 [Bradyrhizobium sp. UFLA03-84]|nr:hypothetical protein CK489_16605 [Bradyrhizobium sp. UFLA03-84]
MIVIVLLVSVGEATQQSRTPNDKYRAWLASARCRERVLRARMSGHGAGLIRFLEKSLRRSA